MMDVKNATSCLADMQEVFERNGIKFWLEAGSLLGAIREKGLIPWDNDIDLGIFAKSVKSKEIRKKLTRELNEKGFVVEFFWNVFNIDRDKININIQLTFEGDKETVVIKRMKCDTSLARFLIQMHRLSAVEHYGNLKFEDVEGKRHLIKTNLYVLLSKIPKKLRKPIYMVPQLLLSPFKKITSYHLHIPRSDYLESKKINFLGLQVDIPKDPEEHLRRRYGSGWKTPPKKWKEKEWFMYGDWSKHQNIPNFQPLTS
jgi:phosphorylcholine metabolism protein LicD